MPLEQAPALTIAIPFYRGQDYLRQALDSVRRQERGDWRLIVCDDAGPEIGTRALVDSHDERITYVRNEHNLGMAGNWNRCLDLAATDLVTLLHADDQLLPNYVAVMSEAAARDPGAALFFCRSLIIDAGGQPCFSLPDYVKRFLEPGGAIRLEGQAGLQALLHGDFIMCPTVCYRKSQLGPRRFAPEWQQVLDLELYTRLLLEGERLVGVPQVAFAYRRHADNATARQTRDLVRFQEESTLYDRLAAAAESRGWAQAARLGRRKRIIKLHVAYRILADAFGLRPGAAWRKLRFLWGLGVV